MEDRIIDSIKENFLKVEKLEENVRLFNSLTKDSKVKLLNAIMEIKEEITGRFLNLIYEHEGDKDVLKKIRKIVFSLKTRGIKVDEPLKKGEAALRQTEEVKDRKIKSYITNFDYYNQMAVLMGIELKKKNFLLVHGEIEFPNGLKNLNIVPFKKDEFEHIISSSLFEQKDKLAFSEAPVNFAYRILKEASSRSKRFMEEIRGLNDILKENSIEFKKEFNIYGLTVPDETHRIEIYHIFSHSFFEFFKFRWDGFEDDRERYREIKNPAIILPRYMIEEKRQAFIRGLVESERIKKLIPYLKTVLEIYAYLFYAHREFSYYKGLVDYMRGDEDLTYAVLYLIEKNLEQEKDEERFLEANKMIINPFDIHEKE
ncbi:MAG: hypothetical protein N2596_06610 [Syntrophorhabdaceae bacterium]|nr:hypothetical protein [Syntrophorhabdaceae bacterium]